MTNPILICARVVYLHFPVTTYHRQWQLERYRNAKFN